MNNEQINFPVALEEISLEVQGIDGATYCAIIWPMLLSAGGVTGTVEWDGNPPQFSLIKARGKRLTPWGQRLMLVYAATDKNSAPAEEFLCEGQWTTATLFLQNLLGAPGELVRVSMSRQDNLTTLEVDAAPGLNNVMHIPPCLQTAAVGLALVEMTSRILLGHTWQTQEFVVP
ncbi:hypothetical protein [Rhodoferax sp.]|uniref:hypothetical protein n=1 Tax=Rhodoferax sp. TaxID=50421 RepID=UPI002842DCBF|nr:hypothetical protein [Rhodoferax sp.]MDR3367991.1 hypothetical protein [Rhodoferax sp.]